MRYSPLSLASAATLILLAMPAAHAQTVNINFDTDASGNAINAPTFFSDTTPLTTAYSSLGVTFSGPAPGQGGAILNDTTFPGPKARSGRNFLAFNRALLYTSNPQSLATDPETLSFSSNVSSVSIYASGASNTANTFLMQAFDAQNVALTSFTATNVAGQYTLLSVSGAGIRSVRLTSTAGNSAFTYDDLTFVVSGSAAAPEPASLALLGMGALPLAGMVMRRRRK